MRNKPGVTVTELATDWLRLAMYFFHPIQTCAQQIYHTALPMSPTSSRLHPIHRIGTSGGQLSHLTTFCGVPHHWGSILTTITVKLGRITCISAFSEKIAIACEGVLNIYDAVTFVLEQTLHAPQPITQTQGSGDGSILYLRHPRSVTLWDVQTGGLVDSLTVESWVKDIAVSPMGDRIACNSYNHLSLLNIRTRVVEVFETYQPLVCLRWLPLGQLLVATEDSIYLLDSATGNRLGSFDVPGRVWGVVDLENDGFFVVYSWVRERNQVYLTAQLSKGQEFWESQKPNYHTLDLSEGQLPKSLEQLLVFSTRAGKVIACITPPQGVQVLDVSDPDVQSNGGSYIRYCAFLHCVLAASEHETGISD